MDSISSSEGRGCGKLGGRHSAGESGSRRKGSVPKPGGVGCATRASADALTVFTWLSLTDRVACAIALILRA